ncbi:MAG: hypothetical protein Q7S89_00010 [bacterium]|nr:hypothetical protein [bacterium]
MTTLPIPKLLACSTCPIDDKQGDCLRCRGKEVVFGAGSLTFFWRHPFVPSYFQDLRTRKTLRVTINTVLWVTGIIAFVLFGYFQLLPIFLQQASANIIFTSNHWTAQFFLDLPHPRLLALCTIES